jgi:outer membrane protein OmpA-like peptidoglycan-associated protein
MPDTRNSSPSTPTGPDSRTSTLRAFLPSLIVLIGVLGVGYLILDRMSGLEQRIEEFDRQVDVVVDQAEDAISVAAAAQSTADSALDRALGAEESAAIAAVSREVAQSARQRAEVATAQAEVARAEAESVAFLATEDADRARADLERVEQERQEELDRLQAALGAIVDTRRTALGLVMSLDSSAIEFGFDRADLAAGDRELLSRIAGILLTSAGFSVAVYGHTDDVGTRAYNQELSERRARSVRDYLVEAGVNSDILSTLGYGQSSPRVQGTTAEARAKNRRVEIAIIDVTLGPAREIEIR